MLSVVDQEKSFITSGPGHLKMSTLAEQYNYMGESSKFPKS